MASNNNGKPGGFSFGTTTSQSLFGNTSTPPSSGGLFGGGNSNTNTSNAPTASTPTSTAEGGSMAPPNSVLFSAANTQSSSGPVDFGRAAAEYNSGSSTPQGQKPGGLFGDGGLGASTTPAGEPKQQSVFGNQGKSTGSLFGAGGTSSAGGGFSFGQTASNTSTSGAGGLFGQKKDEGQQSKPLFGGGSTQTPPSSSGGLFGGGSGNTATTSASKPGSMFGGTLGGAANASTQSPGSAFGQKPGGLFGAQNNAAQATPGAENKAPSTGLFGAKNATTTSGGSGMLGSTATASSTPSNLFSQNQSQNTSSATTGAATTTTSTPSLFGQQNQSNNATAGASNAMGGPGSIFENGGDKQKPTGGGLFSGLNTSSSASTPASTTATSGPTLGGGLLGGQTTQNQQPASGGLGLFGKQPATTSAGAGTGSLFPSAPPAGQDKSSAPSNSLFSRITPPSQPATTSAAASSAPSTQAPTTTAGGGGLSLFGSSTMKPAENKTTGPSLFSNTTTAGPSTTTPGGTSGGPSAGGASGGAATSAPSGLNSSTTNTGAAAAAGAAPPSGSRLAHKSLDEILTMWSTSLSQHQKSFQNLAKRVSAWDRQLVENSSKISNLYGRCFQAERDTSEVERQLTTVEHQQVELEHFLDKYEEDVDRMMANTGVSEDGIGGVDAERERTYKMAENCSSRLGELSTSLTDMVEEINSTSGKLSEKKGTGEEGEKGDPLRQIVGILNRHLAQLQTIGTGAQALQEKVGAAQKDVRNLGSQGLNGANWVDDFGRSYLGRR